MGMRGERTRGLLVAHAHCAWSTLATTKCYATSTAIASRERRAREAGVQRACRLERNRDRERARQRRAREGSEQRACRLERDRERARHTGRHSGRDLKPEYRKD